MTDENNTKSQQHPRQGSALGNVWVIILLIIAMFIVACLSVPALGWIFFFAFVVSIGGVIYLSAGAANTDAKLNFDSKLNVNLGNTQELRKSLAEALQFPAYILDKHGKIIYANSASKTAFGGVSNNDNIYIRFRQPQIRQLIGSALSSENALRGEYNEPIPDDRWFAVEMSPIPSMDTHQSSPLFLLGFHDLSEAKRTDQMRSDFIANASHELRTPLASLLGYIETIKGPARKDEKAIDRFTDVMLDQAQRMTRLVNDLLSLSRIEMQSHVRPSNVINLSEVISSVIDPLERMARRLDVRIEFNNTQAVNIIGDRDELLQVFENLIENACKYGEEGKKVVVTLEVDEEEQEVTASVRDFGPGIAGEHQQRITERFYRVDVARSREKQGTGLGLAIVKHILNRHATKLGIESSLGKGTRFFVKFPVVKQS